ncbi:MAG: hypothetical protein ABIQ59_12925 [Nocardioidaceae bacterium]
MCEDHDLHPVAQRELAQDRADVVFTVDSLASTSAAISVFERPRATASKISRSLSVRPG